MARGKETETIEIMPGSYIPDEIQEQIKEQYGSFTGFTAIKLYRMNPAGEEGFLEDYLTLPNESNIKNKYGGGRYKLWIQWKVESKDFEGKLERKYDVRKFLIEGDPIISTPTAASGPGSNGYTNPEHSQQNNIIETVKLLKELGLIGQPAVQTDSSVIVAGMNKSAEMMMATAKMLSEKPENTDNKELMGKLVDVALAKSTENEMDKTLKTMDTLNKFNNKHNGDGESDTLGLILKVLPDVLPLLTGKNAGGPGMAGNANSLVQILQTLTENIDKNFKVLNAEVTSVKTDLIAISASVKELQDEIFEPEENQEIPAMEVVNNNGEENGMKQGAWLRELPPEQKAAELNKFLATYPVPVVCKWCIDNKAVDTLEQFNEIMKLAGREAYSGV